MTSVKCFDALSLLTDKLVFFFSHEYKERTNKNKYLKIFSFNHKNVIISNKKGTAFKTVPF